MRLPETAMIPLRILAVALSLLPLAGCVNDADGAPRAAAPPSGRACFNARLVNSFTPVGRDAVDVRVGANRYYRLGLDGTCLDVDFSFRVALRARSGATWICNAYDAELIVPGHGIGPQRCPVLSVRQLTPEEVSALYGSGRHRDRH
jgi:hypothetical protein